MYLILMILRELRKLFNNKVFKMGFTIAILTIAIFNFFAWLPSSKSDAATRIDVNMNFTLASFGKSGNSDLSGDVYNSVGSSTWTIGSFEQFYAYDYSQSQISGGLHSIAYFPCSSQIIYHIGNGYTGSGQVLVLYTTQAPNVGVSAGYIKNITGYGSYDIVAPGNGFICFYFTEYNGNTNPLTCYYMYDSEVTQQDIQTSTNTTTNTIITESQETRNTITDSNVDNTITDLLPEDTFQNPYESNVDSIFTKIYNAFTVSQYNDLTISIPFTNKTFKVGPQSIWGSYTAPMLPNILKNLINTFWWYIISRFIILDILNVIEKIKNGKIENIETSNVKEDML